MRVGEETLEVLRVDLLVVACASGSRLGESAGGARLAQGVRFEVLFCPWRRVSDGRSPMLQSASMGLPPSNPTTTWAMVSQRGTARPVAPGQLRMVAGDKPLSDILLAFVFDRRTSTYPQGL